MSDSKKTEETDQEAPQAEAAPAAPTEPSEPEASKSDDTETAESTAEAENASSAAPATEEADPKAAEDAALPPVASGKSAPGEKRPSESMPAMLARIGVGALLMLLGFGGTFFMMTNSGQLPRGPLIGLGAMLVGCAGLLTALGLFTRRSESTPLAESAFGVLPGEPIFLSPIVTVPAALLAVLGTALFAGAKPLPIAIVIGLVLLLLSAWRRPAMLTFVLGSGIMLPMLGAYGLWDPWETHYGEVAREILSRDDWISLWWAQEDWFWSKPIFIFWSEALTMGALGTGFKPDLVLVDAQNHFLHPEWALRLPVYFVAIGAVMSVFAAIKKVFSARAGVVCGVVLATSPHFFLLSHQAITDMYFVANMTIATMFLVIAFAEKPGTLVRDYGLRLGPLELRVSAQHVALAFIVLVALPQALYLMSRNVTWVPDAGGFAWHGDTFLSGSAGNAGVPGNSPLHDVEPAFPDLAAQPFAQGLYWLVGLVAIVVMTAFERRKQALAMTGFYVFCAFAFMSKGIPGFALPGLVALAYLVASRRWKLLFDGQLYVARGILTVLVIGSPWFVAMYLRHGPAFTDRLLIHDHLNRLAAGVHGDTGSVQYFIEQLGFGLFPWVALAPAALTSFLHETFGRRAPAAAESIEGESPAPVLLSSEQRARAARDMGLGGGAVLIGLLITAVTYTSSSGGLVVVAWGAILFGAVQFFRGLLQLGGPATQLASGGAAVLVGGGDAPVSLPREATGHGGTAAGEAEDAAFHQRETATMIALWFVCAFVLFSAMITKFHHYIFPAVPPIAILVGILVDRMLGDSSGVSLAKRAGAWALGIAAPLLGIAGVGGLFGDLRGLNPRNGEDTFDKSWVLEHAMPLPLSVLLIVLGVAAFGGAVWLLWRRSARVGLESAGLAAGLAAAPVVAAFVGRDLSWVTSGNPAGYERLIHLFVYNYQRPWPDGFDYQPILTGFAICATALLAASAIGPLRAVAARSLLTLAFAFAVWGLDIYLVDLSPHWGQREVIEHYYRERRSPSEALIAWQMNWKGENFYSGNRVSCFVDLDNTKLMQWVQQHRGERAFFMLEHSRLSSLRSVLGHDFRNVTFMRTNNKFLMVQVDL